MPDGALITERSKNMSETPWVPGNDAAATEQEQQPDFEPITSQQDFEKRIKGRINKVAQKYADYDDLKSFASEAQTKISDLTKELETERFNVQRNQVAAEKGVPAHRISGSTLEELEASAEEYLNEISQMTKSKNPRGSFKSGATATGNQIDPKDKAAMMLQQMFGLGGDIVR